MISLYQLLFKNLFFSFLIQKILKLLQLEIIEFQSNNYLKTPFEHYSSSENLVEFYSNLSKENFPNVRQLVAKMCWIFSITYIGVSKNFQL